MTMIPFDEALRKILTNLPPSSFEEVDFRHASGRVLAEPLTATCSIPPFSKSAVDGYALRTGDIEAVPATLELMGEIRAGDTASLLVGPGQAAAVMTGAPVPRGADAVQMMECAAITDDGAGIRILERVRPGENIIPAASEASLGQVVLTAGRLIGPAETAALATFGHVRVRVYRRPTVAIMATGSELVEADQVPPPHGIRNSNSCCLAAQLRLLGLEGEYIGIARDERNHLRERLETGLLRDVLLVSGGVSVGAYDFVEEILRELGLEVIFSKVAIRPGKPTLFARKYGKLVFGLPGNPVSTFVSFELFVRAALGRLIGFARPDLPRVQGSLASRITQKAGRTSFLPASVVWRSEGWQIHPLPWKGSSDIIGFSRADGLVVFPAGRDVMEAGDKAEALLLPDYWQRQMTNDG
ncbi:MAG: molybdopterin molybdotransferase MoeA [Acidobacteria bacterium]|nr:molybdopterin molybdotransferase MoeA [Acidobacteriota bacterium]